MYISLEKNSKSLQQGLEITYNLFQDNWMRDFKYLQLNWKDLKTHC